LQHTRTKSFCEKILAQRFQIESLVSRHFPGASAEPFFSLYCEKDADMASTRSSLRGQLESFYKSPAQNTRYLTINRGPPSGTQNKPTIHTRHCTGAPNTFWYQWTQYDPGNSWPDTELSLRWD
jgi:hypothetical protein